MRPFVQKLREECHGFRKRRIDVLQVNMGKYCNQACLHCHVEAGPGRREIMSRETVDAVVDFLKASRIPKVDLTGGAPELNPHFDYLVEACTGLGRHVMDRCNLTVFFEKDKDYLPEFFRSHRVEVIASLPCYTEENVDEQRGRGTFDLSIRALRKLNRLGYGLPGTGLLLNLVYNPLGAHLPPPQESLERDYKRLLGERFDVTFNHLYCLTNMPITRFAKFLKSRGEYAPYLKLLETNFNAATLDRVMCRDLLSVGWEGSLYDCDFNQMLGMAHHNGNGRPPKIWDVAAEDMEDRPIHVGDHCYACTAGAGSSCGGTLVS